MAKKETTRQSVMPNFAYQAVAANALQPGSFAGIPNEAVGDLFNRMDTAYAQNQQALSNMQEMITRDLADASPEDRQYLQGVYDRVTGVINEASSQNDFQNRVRQVRDLARSITGDVNYMNIQNNIKQGKVQRDTYNKMVSELGAENVTFSGDFYGDGFASVGPNGEINQLRGTPTERPDYTAEQQKLFTPRLEVTQTPEAVLDFIETEGFDMWIGQQAGRIHINDMARSMYNRSFSKLNTERNIPDPAGSGKMYSERDLVVEAVKDSLKAAGLSRVGQYGTASTRNRLQGSQSYLNTAPAPTATGMYSTMITDGTEANDTSIPTYYTNVPTEGLELHLKNMFQSDMDMDFVPMGEKFAGSRRDKITMRDVEEAHLTAAIHPETGHPLVQVGITKGRDANRVVRQVGYVTMEPEDFRTFWNQAEADFMTQQQMNGTNIEARKLAYPILQLGREPQLGPFLKNAGNQEGNTYYEVNPENVSVILPQTNTRSPIYVVRQDDGKFTLKANNGQQTITIRKDGERIAAKDLGEREVRNIIGTLMYNQITGVKS